MDPLLTSRLQSNSLPKMLSIPLYTHGSHEYTGRDNQLHPTVTEQQ